MKQRNSGPRAGLCLILMMAALLAPPSLFAQSRAEYRRIASGTGFFINRSGHIVTNEHVVRQCRQATVRNTALPPTKAEIVSIDPQLDLAMLRIRGIPPSSAPIRSGSRAIAPGNTVLVIGYPGRVQMAGDPTIAEAKVVATDGPAGNPQWISFSDSAQLGNSGGPLLDASGNVIGVVTAKTEMVRINPANGREEVIDRSDVAVSLPYLMEFLKRNRVYPRTLASSIDLSRQYLTREAGKFIVQIQCDMVRD